MKKEKTTRKKGTSFFAAALALLLIIAAMCAIYVSDYYPADDGAIAVFAPDSNITAQKLDDGTLVYIPEEPAAGLVFYPGGKVEYTAYAPLMRACAERGILCALVEMPFNLAVLDMNAAAGISRQYPFIENWYIGGHSLGGSMAALYLARNTEAFDGLILLASYSTADFSNAAVDVLSVYGTEDEVLSRTKYEENASNLPADFSELVIEGGCHAGFGMYGPQKGDGTPTISSAQQIALTASAIADFVNA